MEGIFFILESFDFDEEKNCFPLLTKEMKNTSIIESAICFDSAKEADIFCKKYGLTKNYHVQRWTLNDC